MVLVSLIQAIEMRFCPGKNLIKDTKRKDGFRFVKTPRLLLDFGNFFKGANPLDACVRAV